MLLTAAAVGCYCLATIELVVALQGKAGINVAQLKHVC